MTTGGNTPDDTDSGRNHGEGARESVVGADSGNAYAVKVSITGRMTDLMGLSGSHNMPYFPPQLPASAPTGVHVVEGDLWSWDTRSVSGVVLFSAEIPPFAYNLAYRVDGEDWISLEPGANKFSIDTGSLAPWIHTLDIVGENPHGRGDAPASLQFEVVAPLNPRWERVRIDGMSSAVDHTLTVSQTTRTAAIFDISAFNNLSVTSTIHYVVLARGAMQPTAAQIMAGQDADGKPATFQGAVSTNRAPRAVVWGLAANTGYSIFSVAWDGEKYGPVKQNGFTTAA